MTSQNPEEVYKEQKKQEIESQPTGGRGGNIISTGPLIVKNRTRKGEKNCRSVQTLNAHM